VGLVVAPHGIAGVVKVKATDDEPDWLAQPPLMWASRKGETTLNPCKVLGGQWLKNSVVFLTLEGVTTRTKAEAWVGANLYIAQADLPPPPDQDSYRAFELEGMTALAADTGETLGTVTALAYSRGKGQSFLELTLLPHSIVRLIPFNHTFVPQVDREAKTITVQGLEDFLRDEAVNLPKPKKPKFKGKGKRQVNNPAKGLPPIQEHLE